jgi:hypothetical protein
LCACYNQREEHLIKRATFGLRLIKLRPGISLSFTIPKY